MRDVLHVGCGAATIKKMTPGFQDGWREIRFDINPGVRPDIVGTITDMAGVADESLDAVYSSHNIEHVFAHEVSRVLREFLRVLKPDGFLVVTCPDIETVAGFVAQGKLTSPLYQSPSGPISALDIMFGHSLSIRSGEEYMAHRTAFTQDTLSGALREVGFAMVASRRRQQYFDLWALATKSLVTEDKARELTASYLPQRMTSPPDPA